MRVPYSQNSPPRAALHVSRVLFQALGMRQQPLTIFKKPKINVETDKQKLNRAKQSKQKGDEDCMS